MNYDQSIAFLENARLLIEAIKVANVPEPDITIESEEICLEWYDGNGQYARCDISRKYVHVLHSHKDNDVLYSLTDHAVIIAKLKEFLRLK